MIYKLSLTREKLCNPLCSKSDTQKGYHFYCEKKLRENNYNKTHQDRRAKLSPGRDPPLAAVN